MQTNLEKALLAAIIESSEDAIVSKTLEGIVTSWNAAAERLFGWTPKEMVGQSILRLIPPELHYEEAEIIARLKVGERIERYETRRVRKDCTELYVSLTISPIRGPDERIVGASKIVHDISERHRLQQIVKDREARLNQALAERDAILESERAARTEAERLSHLKDEFLATLSHELRTPLNAVQGWTHLLMKGPLSEDQSQGLKVIERNVRAQSRIISDLLDMSRIVSGKIMLEVQPMRLQQVIESSLDTVRQAAEGKRIRLHALMDSSIEPMRGDPNRLQQAICNLLTNAIKFTPAGGRVQVVLERANSHVEISVEDTGIGIPQDFLPFMFDRFRQADASTTRRYGGLGLGLSIVKSLVEQHGGTVRVKSRGENLGSTFTVCLPVSPVQLAPDVAHLARGAGAGEPDTPELPRLDGIRILVVDDEADGRALLVRILTDQGAECAEAGSARAALVKLSEECFDMLLSDIGMPEMDGYALIREARVSGTTRTAPLAAIAITAYARAEDRQRSLLAGYHAHLAKPIEASELVATVAGLIRLVR